MTNKATIRKTLCLKIRAGISPILRFAVTVIAILWMPAAVYAWDENKSYIEQTDIDASEFMIRIQTGNILSFIIGVAILALLIVYSKKISVYWKAVLSMPCIYFILASAFGFITRSGYSNIIVDLIFLFFFGFALAPILVFIAVATFGYWIVCRCKGLDPSATIRKSILAGFILFSLIATPGLRYSIMNLSRQIDESICENYVRLYGGFAQVELEMMEWEDNHPLQW